jgi:hypothetical protein
MKQIFAILFLCAVSMAFQVNTVTNFPTTMYGGGSYSASYHVDDNAVYPLYATVNVVDGMTVEGCPAGVCTINSDDFSITVNLVSNITPDQYNISVTFSGEYDPGNVSTTLNDTEIIINGAPMTNETIYTGNLTVTVESGNDSILTFEQDFDASNLDLSSINITTGNVVGAAFIEISGVNASGGMIGTKTAYLYGSSLALDSVCIKDAENVTVAQVSAACNAFDETRILCNGVMNAGYTCTRNGTTLKVSGLKHSTLLQQQTPVTASSGSYSGSSGSSGSGGASYFPPNKIARNETEQIKQKEADKGLVEILNKTGTSLVLPAIPDIPKVIESLINVTRKETVATPTAAALTGEVPIELMVGGAALILLIVAVLLYSVLKPKGPEEIGTKKEGDVIEPKSDPDGKGND